MGAKDITARDKEAVNTEIGLIKAACDAIPTENVNERGTNREYVIGNELRGCNDAAPKRFSFGDVAVHYSDN